MELAKTPKSFDHDIDRYEQIENSVQEMLMKLGLTQNESKLYIHLNTNRLKEAREIAQNQKIPRTYTYNLLKELLNKRIVTETFERPTKFEETDNSCDDVGCTSNDWIKDTLKDKLRTQLHENTIDLENNVEDIEPIIEDKLRIFDCDSGIMYENGNVVGNCSEFDLRQGKVFDEGGKQIGITQGLKSMLELKNPTIEL